MCIWGDSGYREEHESSEDKYTNVTKTKPGNLAKVMDVGSKSWLLVTGKGGEGKLTMERPHHTPETLKGTCL